MPTFKTILTDIGLAKISNAVALGQTVNLTKMAIGDGGGDSVEPKQTQVNLVNELYRAQLNRLDVDSDNPNYIISELVVPANVGGWTVREVGILDEENDLIAVANFPETYKPQLSEGSSRDLVIRVYIEVVNTEVVELKVDPSVVLASRQWVVDNFISGLGGTLEGAISKTVTAKPQRIGNLPVVSFVFDDGYESHYNDVAPLFESKGFRCGFAINSKLQEAETTRSTIEQMLSLQNRGFEIMNHGATHADLRPATTLQSLAESEINNGFDDLTAMGFDLSLIHI